jgi:hypothetical protein
VNKREAFANAQRLWGKQAGVHYSHPSQDVPGLRYYMRCWVGSQTYACNDGKGKTCVYGKGRTWELAFEDAKKRYKYWELPQ